MSATDRRPVLLVVNPHAGGGQGEAMAARARAALAERGATSRLERSTAPGEARALAKRLAADHRLVAAVGGDGTLHEVANGLLDARLPSPPALGLVPVGTGNDYARMLGLHGASPEDAARALVDAAPRPVDVARLEGLEGGVEHVINNLGLAYLADATARRDTFRRLGPISYLLGGFVGLAAFRARRLTLTVDGVSLEGRFLFIHVGIGAWCGRGIRFVPDRRRLDEGRLDVVVAAERSKLRALLEWQKIRVGAQRDDLAMLGGRRLRVVGPKGFTLHVDGEMRSVPLGVLEITLVPGALRVVGA